MSEDEWVDLGRERLERWRMANSEGLTYGEESAFEYAWELAWEEMEKFDA